MASSLDFADFDRQLIVTDSSRIKEIRYSTDQHEMLVLFSDESIYQYYEVMPDVFGKLASAYSIGSILRSEVKGFNYRKIK